MLRETLVRAGVHDEWVRCLPDTPVLFLQPSAGDRDVPHQPGGSGLGSCESAALCGIVPSSHPQTKGIKQIPPVRKYGGICYSNGAKAFRRGPMTFRMRGSCFMLSRVTRWHLARVSPKSRAMSGRQVVP